MTRKSIELFSNESDRAVSPVIGVILMVAITVILAAVIGTFVLGLGENVSTSTPQSQLTLSADAPSASNNGTIHIDHNGGDPIPAGDIKVVVTDNGDNKTVFNPGTGTSGELSVGDSGTLTLIDGGSTLDWGTATGLPVDSPDSANVTYSPVRVQIIHQPSDQLILDRKVRP